MKRLLYTLFILFTLSVKAQIVVQKNGTVPSASSSDINAGTSTTEAITPAGLAGSNYSTTSLDNRYVKLTGNSSSNPITGNLYLNPNNQINIGTDYIFGDNGGNLNFVFQNQGWVSNPGRTNYLYLDNSGMANLYSTGIVNVYGPGNVTIGSGSGTLSLNSGSAIAIGGPAYFNQAANYQADYSSSYSSRSLIDKGYLVSQLANYLPYSGGTLTGALILAADPTSTLGAATKQYVDNSLSTSLSNYYTKTQSDARYLQGNQTITLTGGQASGSGTTSIPVTIEDTVTRPYKPYGVEIYNKAQWTSVSSDFFVEGTSPTISTTGGIVYSGGSSNYNNDLLMNFVNDDENIELEVTFKVNSLTGYSPFVGKRNYQANNGQGFVAGYDLTNNKSIILMAYFDSPSSPRASSLAGHAVAVNDVCKIKYTKNGSTIISTFVDVTQGFSCVTTWTNNEADSETISNMAIFNYNSSCEIKQINLWTNTTPKPYILCIGDSKTKNPSQSQRFPHYLDALGPTEVWASQSATTQDFAYCIPYLCQYFRPKYAILCLGRNDVAYGLDTTTMKNDIISFVTKLDSIGSTVYHLLIPDADANQTVLWNFIKRTYPNNYIDASVGWQDVLYLSSDSTHPNADGTRFIAQTIINSGKIPLSNLYAYDPVRDDASYYNSGNGNGYGVNRYAKTFQNNYWFAPQNFGGSFTAAQPYGLQGNYTYTANANSQTFSGLNLSVTPSFGSFTGCKAYSLQTSGADILIGSTSTAPSVQGEFANISGVPKWYNGSAVSRLAQQTDATGTSNQVPVYNSSGLVVPTTIYSALGDLNYGGSSGAPTTLPGNTTTTKKYLTQTGTGSASAAPGWNTIANSDLPSSGVTAGTYSTSTVNAQGIATAGGHLSLTGDATGTESGGAVSTTVGKINGSTVTATTNQGVITTSASATSTVFQTQKGGENAATASGTNTYTATISPAISSYTSNQRFWINFTNANTGASTLNLNSVGAISIVKSGSTALAGGEISAGQIMELVYDGTNFQLIGGSGSSSSLTLTTTGTSGVATYSSGVLNIPNYGSTTGMSNPMTNNGDMIYGGSGGTPADLGGNTTTTKNFLTSTGTGSAANAPAWGTIAGSDVPTTLPSLTTFSSGILSNTIGSTSSSSNITMQPATAASGTNVQGNPLVFKTGLGYGGVLSTGLSSLFQIQVPELKGTGSTLQSTYLNAFTVGASTITAGSNHTYIGWFGQGSPSTSNYHLLWNDASAGNFNISNPNTSGNVNLNINGSSAFSANTSVCTVNGYIKATNVVGTSSAPSVSAGTGAGTSPTITITGTNTDGRISVTIGSSPSGSSAVIATITYSGSFAYPTNSFTTITPYNANAQELSWGTSATMPIASTNTTTSWQLVGGPTALTASTTYVFTYHTGGN